MKLHALSKELDRLGVEHHLVIARPTTTKSNHSGSFTGELDSRLRDMFWRHGVTVDGSSHKIQQDIAMYKRDQRRAMISLGMHLGEVREAVSWFDRYFPHEVNNKLLTSIDGLFSVLVNDAPDQLTDRQLKDVVWIVETLQDLGNKALAFMQSN